MISLTLPTDLSAVSSFISAPAPESSGVLLRLTDLFDAVDFIVLTAGASTSCTVTIRCATAQRIVAQHEGALIVIIKSDLVVHFLYRNPSHDQGLLDQISE